MILNLITLAFFLAMMFVAHWEHHHAKEWERRCRAAWARDVIPRSILQESGFDLKAGPMLTPIYKAIAIFDVTQDMRIEETCIMRGNHIYQQPMPLDVGPVDLVSGDRVFLAVDIR